MAAFSKNPFGLLDESAEPAAPAVKTESTPSNNNNKKDNSRSKPGENSNRSRNEYPPRGGKGKALLKDAPLRDRNGKGGNFEHPPESNSSRGGNRGGRRGGRGGSASTKGAREFDKHSRSDRVDGEKKDVAGRSWGDPVSSELESAPIDSFPPAEGGDGYDAEKKSPEPEEVQMTLEQYMSEKNSKKTAAAAPRQANEGADDSQWKDAVKFAKQEEDFLVLSKPQKSASGKSKGKSEKQFVDIEQRFTDESRENRRGGRGGRGRGGRSSKAINVTDTKAFPSLG